MCDPRVDDRDLPVCPCGGSLFLVDNQDDNEQEDFEIWGICESCGRTGQKFDDVDDALEDLYTWK
jgi:hypothetical protein